MDYKSRNTTGGLEKKLIERYQQGKTSIENRSIAEQMADEIFQANIEIRPRKTPEYKPNRITNVQSLRQDEIHLNKMFVGHKTDYKDRISYSLGNAFYYACMGALDLFIAVCKAVEEASINHLSKTRPDVANMMKKGAGFSELSEQYFKRGIP